MPLYEFHCKEHGRFELFCRMGVDSEICPDCGESCAKVMSLASISTVSKKYNVPKSVDKAVGKAADKAREYYENKRRKSDA